MDNPAFRNDHMYAATCASMAARSEQSVQLQATVSSVTQQQSLHSYSETNKPRNHKQENNNVKKDSKSAKNSTEDGLWSPLVKRSARLCPEQKDKGQIDGKHVTGVQKEICHEQITDSSPLIPAVSDKCSKNVSSEKDFTLQSLDHQYHAADKRPFHSVENMSVLASDDQISPSAKCLHSPPGEEVLDEDRNATSVDLTEGDHDKNARVLCLEQELLRGVCNDAKNTGDDKLNTTGLERECGMSSQQKREVITTQKLPKSTLTKSQVGPIGRRDNSNLSQNFDERQQLQKAATNAKVYTTAADLLEEPETDATTLYEMGTDCENVMEVADSFENEEANDSTEVQSVQKNIPVGKKQTTKTSGKIVKTKDSPKARNVNNSKELEKIVTLAHDSVRVIDLTGLEHSDSIMDSTEPAMARHSAGLEHTDSIVDCAESGMARHSAEPQKVSVLTEQEESVHLTDSVETLGHSEISGSTKNQNAKDLTKSSKCEDCTEHEKCVDLGKAELSRDRSGPSEIKKSTGVRKTVELANLRTAKEPRNISNVVESEQLGITQEGSASGKDLVVGQRSSLEQQRRRKNKKRSHEDAGLSMLKCDAREVPDKTSIADDTPSKKRRSKKRAAFKLHENTSQYLIPLKEHGWLREVVFRNVFSDLTPSGQKPADIYYRTPEGTKLRSMVQVTQYLRDHPSVLEEDNFTFLRKPLFEEPWELVRNAGSPGRGTSASKLTKKDKTVAHTTPKHDQPQKQQDSDPVLSPSPDASNSEEEEQNNEDEDWSVRSVSSVSSISSGSSDFKKAKGLIRTRGRGRGWLRGNWEVREEPHEMEILIQDMPPPEVIIDRADEGEGLALGEDSLDGSQFTADQPEEGRSIERERNILDGDHVDRNHDKTAYEASPPFEPVHFNESRIRLQSSAACVSKATARKSTTPRMKQKLPCSKSSSARGIESSRGQLCSNVCPGQNGQPPELQCCVCMCLFHHKCVNMEKSCQAAADHFRCLRCISVPTPPPSVSPPCRSSGKTSTSRQDLVQAPPLAALPPSEHLSVPAPPLTIMQQPSVAASHIVIPIVSGQSTHQNLTARGANLMPSEALQQSVDPNNSDAMRGMVEKQGQIVGSSPPPLVTPSPPRLLMRGAAPPPLTHSNKANPPPGLVQGFRPPPQLMAAPGIPALMGTPVTSIFQPAALNGSLAVALLRGPTPVSAPLEKNSNLLTSLGTSASTLPPASSAGLYSMPSPNPVTSVTTLAVASTVGKISMAFSDLAIPGSTSTVPLPAGKNSLPLPHSTPSTSVSATSSHSGKNPPWHPNPAQVLTLPASIVRRVNLNKTLALKINNRHILVPPYCVLKSRDTVKVVLPPGTFIIPPNSQTMLSLTVSNNILSASTPSPTETTSPAITAGQDKEPTIKTIDVSSSVDKNKSTDRSSGNRPLVRHQPRRKSCSQINPSQCMMHRLFGGFDAMLQIFHFLDVPDLFTASQVCSSWLQIARQQSLWQTVNLKNLFVTDWEKASTFMRKCGTQKLLLKGLKHKSNQSQAWESFVENLSSLAGLQHIEFGLVPAVVVHATVEKLTQLEVFKAEYITLYTDIYCEQMWTSLTKLDVGKFGTLSRLQELRLRGVLGLVLPTFTFNGNLAELTHLKHLHSLSLTSLHGVRDIDFNFLAEMKHLRILELGNCVNWTSETYARLGELQELRHLRLECGGEIPDVGLGNALLNLTKLERLELILFVLPASLNRALSELSCLHTLALWPDTGCGILPATVNSNAVAAVLNVKHLQVLEWGLMVSEPGCKTDTHSQTQVQPVEDSSTISVLCNGCSLDLDFQHSNDDILNLTVKEFTERLCSALPLCTTIRVFSTQVVGRMPPAGAL